MDKETLLRIPVYTPFTCKRTDTGQSFRGIKEEPGTVFIYGYRKKRRGCRYYDLDKFLTRYTDIRLNVDSEEKWKKRIRNTVKKLQDSGLWPEMLTFYENLSLLSFKDWQTICHIHGSSLTKQEMLQHLAPYMGKYPFLFTEDNEGNPALRLEYISEQAECKTKPMYFGKQQNKYVKDCIKDHLTTKTSCRTGKIRTNYDVSFTYDAEKNKAWYSEEYRDCANGHYYIALNHSTALFIEDD